MCVCYSTLPIVIRVCFTDVSVKERSKKLPWKCILFCEMFRFSFYRFFVWDLLYALKAAIDLYDGKYTSLRKLIISMLRLQSVHPFHPTPFHTPYTIIILTTTAQTQTVCINDIFIYHTIFIHRSRIATEYGWLQYILLTHSTYEPASSSTMHEKKMENHFRAQCKYNVLHENMLSHSIRMARAQVHCPPEGRTSAICNIWNHVKKELEHIQSAGYYTNCGSICWAQKFNSGTGIVNPQSMHRRSHWNTLKFHIHH